MQPIAKQAVLVVTKSYHATDCEYIPALAAFVDADNDFKLVAQGLPAFFTRGGIGFEYDGSGIPIVVIWSERYQAQDVHYTGPSKFEVYKYRFDSASKKYVLKLKSLIPTGDLIVPKNLLEEFPHLMDC